MTTIAYRDGVLAADTRATDSEYHPGIYRTEKLFRKEGAIIATAGDDAPGMVFVDWYGTKKKPPGKLLTGEADFCILVLNAEGLFWYDKWCRPSKVLDPFYAIGSGGGYAVGALWHGATAEEAVRCAMQFDCYTGGEVQTMKLEL